MYGIGDEVLVKAKIKDIIWAEMMYVCELDTKPGLCIRFKSPPECIADDKNYADGLNDAWELARKAVMGIDDGGLSTREMMDIFGRTSYYTLKDYTAEEALAKIEAYEREKEIKVKAIVKLTHSECTGVVTHICSGLADVMWKDGVSGKYKQCDLVNTGKTAEGLDSLLRQIGE